VHDGVEPLLGKRPIDEDGVGKIADDQCRALVDGFTMTLEQTVENDDLVSGLAKGADAVASDVACST
jgi:shikimate 5-dehydrogenase